MGYFTLRIFNLWAILWGSVAADIEPLTLIILKKCYLCPHHWFFHSFLGAAAGSLILGFILWSFRKKLNYISLKFKIKQSFTFLNLFLSSFFSWAVLHVLPDSLTHYDVFPFWPSKYNPFLIWPNQTLLLIAGFSVLAIVGLFLFRKNLRSLFGKQ